MAKIRHRPDGRSSRRERHVRLPLYMLRSVAWQSLTGNARALYVEIAARHNGFNNGEFPFSNREACEALHVAPGTAKAAFDDLIERGFIRIIRDSSFATTKKIAREWALTIEQVNGNTATKDFMIWKPEK